jgi:hypothetical protein
LGREGLVGRSKGMERGKRMEAAAAGGKGWEIGIFILNYLL